MENKIDLSIIENADVSINQLDKTLNETVKVLGDIKKTLKDSAKKTSESKSAPSSGGGSSKTKEDSAAKQKKLEAMADTLGEVDKVWRKYREKYKKEDAKPSPKETTVSKTGCSCGDGKPTSAAKAVLEVEGKSAAGVKNDGGGFPYPNADYLKNLKPAKQSDDEILADVQKKVLETENKTADEQKKISKRTKEQKIKDYEDVTEAISIGLEGAVEVGKSLNEISKQAIEEKKAEAEEQNEKEKEELKAKYDSGLISKKEYDKKVAESDKKLADTKAELDDKQAARNKAMAIFEIGVNTAIALMKIWADVPKVDFGASTIALTVVAAAMGAAQIAAVAATPAPKARKGGRIVGNSHENGGVLIEAEGGEAIISRAAMSAFPGVAELMNATALGGGISDGGYAARSLAGGFGSSGGRSMSSSSQGGIDYERLSSMMSDKISQAKIYVSVTDINDGQKNYARISDMAKL